MRKKLTEAAVRQFGSKPGKTHGVEFLWDGEVRGFGVIRDCRTGHKSWYAKFSTFNKRIGPVDVMDLNAARAEAYKLIMAWRAMPKSKEERQAIAAAERAARESERAAQVTLRQMLERYITEKTNPKRKGGAIRAETVEMYRWFLDNHLKSWADIAMASITPGMVKTRYKEIADAVEQAGNVPGARGVGTAEMAMRVLSAVWNFAVGEEVPGLGANPVIALRGRRMALNDRTDGVEADKLAAFWQAVEGLPFWAVDDGKARDYPAKDTLKFLLATGLRRRNGLALTWSEVDMEQKVLRFPADRMKGRRPFDLPLSELAMEVLRHRQAMRKYHPDSPYVFASEVGSGHCVDIRAPLRAAAKRAGIAHLTVHGLRRSYAWACRKAGLGVDDTGMLLHHALPPGVTSKYLKSNDSEPLRPAAEAVGAYLARMVGHGPNGDNVVPLTRAA